ncbi:MAG: sigma-54 dependent transcriptional regulator [Spirochaeta sp.]|nr:sigma-54 dependent transcriptional regulator [Spirochaeta sp.]
MYVDMETILLVDDEPGVLAGQQNLLALNGYTAIRTAETIEAARTLLAEEPIALILLDLTLQHGSGITLLEEVQHRFPGTVVIVVTGAADIATAVSCMRKGAYDFLVKGTDTGRLPSTVKNALEHRRVLAENALLREAFTDPAPRSPAAFTEFLTQDEHVRRLFLYLEAVAALSDPILVTGETGVGKELVARGIHAQSGRTGLFVPVNLGGVDDHAFTDTLFGHRKGAFTGADARWDGLVAQAAEGTLFFDEIGEMPVESQARLLRLLDTGEYMPLGLDTPVYSRARIICATNRDLSTAVADGTFRRDLYYRIATHHVAIPPLRDRPGDIHLIATDTVRREGERLGRDGADLPDAILTAFTRLPLPGNVRELKQIILRGLISGSWDGVETEHEAGEAPGGDVPDGDASGGDPPPTGAPGVTFGDTLPTPELLVDLLLLEANRRHPHSRTAAASAISLSPQAFANRWKRMEERGRVPRSNCDS